MPIAMSYHMSELLYLFAGKIVQLFSYNISL